jgi:rare lipoprotein A (peptidoglycan hydrolase)
LKESGILGPAPFILQPTPEVPVPVAPIGVPSPGAIQSVPSGFAVASFYGDEFVGRHTSSGQVFTQDNMTCATNAFPLGTHLRLSTPDGAHSVIVTNNDRPAAWNTRIDLSKAAFAALYPLGSGIGTVKIEVLN